MSKKENVPADTYKQFTKDKTQKNKYKQIIEMQIKITPFVRQIGQD